MQGRKLPDELELKIYNLRINEGLKYRQIAERFGLNTNHIGPIVKRVQKRKDNQKS